MKYSILFVLTISLLACTNSNTKSANANDKNTAVNDSTKQTTIEWLDPVVQDLPKAQEGQVVEIAWRFKNTGDHPLVISEVHAGCGCTVAEKPEEPVAPGEEGVIKAKFDTKGQGETNFKQVYVKANNSNKNGQGEDVLGFKVQVEKSKS